MVSTLTNWRLRMMETSTLLRTVYLILLPLPRERAGVRGFFTFSARFAELSKVHTGLRVEESVALY